MASRFLSLEVGAPIEVLEMCRTYQQDPDVEKRLNLSVGGYEADGGNGGHSFKVVKRVERELAQVNFNFDFEHNKTRIPSHQISAINSSYDHY